MRIGCLQFAPQVGDVDNNLNRADAVLSRASPQNLDLLVLPELAFTGYNFRSLQHITPYLEPTAAGITSLWARTTALKYDCIVTAGYPEKVDLIPKWPAGPEYYNSTITVSADGETLCNYRKSFLYYTDERWALEGNGFFGGPIDGLGEVAMGICMDLNPYKFEAPWNAWEFAHHVLRVNANLVIISMAWLTREDPRAYSRAPREPDMETLSYWLARLEPVIRAEAEGEIVVVFANRCGSEEEAVYAGTSAVIGINAGEVKVYGILGRGEKELLVVDTSKRAQAKLVSQPNSAASVAAPEGPATSDDSPMAQTPEVEYVGSNNTDDSSPDDDYYEFSPVSPSDARFPQQFYDSEAEAATVVNHRNSLLSSIDRADNSTSSQASPTFYRPSSPKSRNHSPSQQHEEEIEPDLAADDTSPVGYEAGDTNRDAQSAPNSAATIPDNYESTFTRNSLGPRSRHVSPRPKSTMW